MNFIRRVVLGAVCLAGTSAAMARGNIEVGAELAVNCEGCHGKQGISPNDIWPNLASQQPGWFIKQMKAYRDGVLPDLIMQTFARNLSDEDIEDMAAFYAGLDCAETINETE